MLKSDFICLVLYNFMFQQLAQNKRAKQFNYTNLKHELIKLWQTPKDLALLTVLQISPKSWGLYDPSMRMVYLSEAKKYRKLAEEAKAQSNSGK